MTCSWSISSSGELAMLPYYSTLEWPFFCLENRLSLCRLVPHSRRFDACFLISSLYLLVKHGKKIVRSGWETCKKVGWESEGRGVGEIVKVRVKGEETEGIGRVRGAGKEKRRK